LGLIMKIVEELIKTYTNIQFVLYFLKCDSSQAPLMD
jgi:hypothetical protein